MYFSALLVKLVSRERIATHLPLEMHVLSLFLFIWLAYYSFETSVIQLSKATEAPSGNETIFLDWLYRELDLEMTILRHYPPINQFCLGMTRQIYTLRHLTAKCCLRGHNAVHCWQMIESTVMSFFLPCKLIFFQLCFSPNWPFFSSLALHFVWIHRHIKKSTLWTAGPQVKYSWTPIVLL